MYKIRVLYVTRNQIISLWGKKTWNRVDCQHSEKKKIKKNTQKVKKIFFFKLDNTGQDAVLYEHYKNKQW